MCWCAWYRTSKSLANSSQFPKRTFCTTLTVWSYLVICTTLQIGSLVTYVSNRIYHVREFPCSNKWSYVLVTTDINSADHGTRAANGYVINNMLLHFPKQWLIEHYITADITTQSPCTYKRRQVDVNRYYSQQDFYVQHWSWYIAIRTWISLVP